jgi:hypothetical protein
MTSFLEPRAMYFLSFCTHWRSSLSTSTSCSIVCFSLYLWKMPMRCVSLFCFVVVPNEKDQSLVRKFAHMTCFNISLFSPSVLVSFRHRPSYTNCLFCVTLQSGGCYPTSGPIYSLYILNKGWIGSWPRNITSESLFLLRIRKIYDDVTGFRGLFKTHSTISLTLSNKTRTACFFIDECIRI